MKIFPNVRERLLNEGCDTIYIEDEEYEILKQAERYKSIHYSIIFYTDKHVCVLDTIDGVTDVSIYYRNIKGYLPPYSL